VAWWPVGQPPSVQIEWWPVGQHVKPVDRPGRSTPYVVAALYGSSRVLFLDVETTGLSRYYDELTLVGWVLDGVYRVHIAGDDPEPLLSALETASVLVTFNGTLFDLAFLTKSFPGLSLPKVHADLRFLAKRAKALFVAGTAGPPVVLLMTTDAIV
jgi:uncharacterized protein YprB with RNaseH-like and TPR domain